MPNAVRDGGRPGLALRHPLEIWVSRDVRDIVDDPAIRKGFLVVSRTALQKSVSPGRSGRP